MKAYLDILKKITESPDSVHKPTRTGVDTISLSGVQFEHDMRDGFPLLTTKKMGMKSISAELEFFIKGFSDKKWLQDRGCTIWDEWANPKKVIHKKEFLKHQIAMLDGEPDEDAIQKLAQREEMDLGRIYGVQWRDWRSFSELKTIYRDTDESGVDMEITIEGKSTPFDQLKDVIERAKQNPLDRRLIVSAWRPDELDEMALPPCHYAWQILSDGRYLDLIWIQRSIDTFLGLPYNIASYGLLLELLALELNLMPRRLVGQLADTHLYENHMEQVKLQLSREPFPLPRLDITKFTNIFEWEYTDLKLRDYNYHLRIKAEIAV